MSVRGWVQGAAWEPLGTELTADVLAGSTVLPVEWTDLFDDEGGDVDIDGVRYSYSAGAVDDEADTITLDTPLAVAASDGDNVLLLSGGQVLSDLTLAVDIGGAAPIDVVVPWEQRDLWPEGDYEDPVQVLLSDDLESIDDVPGRTPSRDTAFLYNPVAMLYKTNDSPLTTGVWTTLSSLAAADPGDIVDVTYEGSGVFRINSDGLYDFRVGATFASNSVGRRAVRVLFGKEGGSVIGRAVRVPASADDVSSGSLAIEVNESRRMVAGESVQFQAWQDSGADLNVLGLNGTQQRTNMMVRREAP